MTGYHRKIIRITADDSPNVERAKREIAQGLAPSFAEVIPGVLSYREYLKRIKTWDKVRQTVGLWAQFYEGAEVLMFPPDWLNLAEDRAERLDARGKGWNLEGKRRTCKAIGIDPAEGGDKTSMCAGDEYGVLELSARKTPDTDAAFGEMVAFIRGWGMWEKGESVCIDRGGGGKEHADRLRAMGCNVRTVAFGEPATTPVHRDPVQFEEKREDRESRFSYVNRRAEMYGIARSLLDPSLTGPDERPRYAIPREYDELRRQLSPIPLRYDSEGRMYLLPKRKDPRRPNVPTLEDLIGCSPDEADSLVLMLFGLTTESNEAMAMIL